MKPADTTILLFVALLVATIYLPFVKNKRWTLLIWAPVVTFDIKALFEIFSPLPHSVGHDSGSGYVGMAVGFYLMFALPFAIAIAISLIVAAFAFPRRPAWNVLDVIAASAVSIGVFYSLNEVTSDRVTIQVIDEQGKPLPSSSVELSTYRIDNSARSSIKATNRDGESKLWVPRYGGWKACARSNGKMDESLEVDKSQQENDEATRILRYSWSGEFQFATIGNFARQRRFVIRLRDAKESVSPVLAKELHQALLDVLNEKRGSLFLTTICDNLESFDEISLLGQIAEKYPDLRSSVASILSQKALRISNAWKGVSDTVKYKREFEEEHNWSYYYTCDWLGFKADFDSLKATNAQIRAKLAKYANDIIAAAKSLDDSDKREIVHPMIKIINESTETQP